VPPFFPSHRRLDLADTPRVFAVWSVDGEMGGGVARRRGGPREELWDDSWSILGRNLWLWPGERCWDDRSWSQIVPGALGMRVTCICAFCQLTQIGRDKMFRSVTKLNSVVTKCPDLSLNSIRSDKIPRSVTELIAVVTKCPDLSLNSIRQCQNGQICH
jgi:hypothetical protein